MEIDIHACGLDLRVEVVDGSAGRLQRLLARFPAARGEPVHLLRQTGDTLAVDGTLCDWQIPDGSPMREDRVFYWLKDLLYRRARDFLFLHGVAVGVKGRAWVLLGGPGAGKSTAAAWWICHGAELVAEHAVPLSSAGGEVHPLPFPLEIADPPTEIIERMKGSGAFDVEIFDDDGHTGVYAGARRVARRPYPLAAVVFLSRRTGVRAWRGQRIEPGSELVARLAAQGLNAAAWPPASWDRLFRIASGTPCLRLEYADCRQLPALEDTFSSGHTM